MTESRDYSQTLFLPKTDFPMRAGLPKNEPKILARWEEQNLYQSLRERSKGREKYVLHDGPPYANGHLHIGHALNKVLKDIITRSFQMRGYDSNYVPGWDCHGLPIEWKIEEKYRKKGKNKDTVPVNEFRQECRDFASEWIGIQAGEFKRLGVVGDFVNPYKTMTFDAEARIAGELMKFAMSGQLFQGSKPVMWSIVEKTALAEAEVEYQDHTSHTIWVKFPISALHGTVAEDQTDMLLDADVVIWTTTPWTIPGNRAVCFSNAISYGLYEITAAADDNWGKVGDKLVLADALAESVFAAARVEGYERKFDVDPSVISECEHPFRGIDGTDGYFDFDVPLIDGDHVTDDAGTGFVHTAPGHGADDYEVFVANRERFADCGTPEVPHTVAEDGSYYPHVPLFQGQYILNRKGGEGTTNPAVIDKLVEVGALLARGKIKHSYPHSWRSKAPLIFRNTPQWFIAMDRDIDGQGDTLRCRALKAIDETRFVPDSGQTRLRSMIETRPDWVISRQRAWGVPITIFIKKDDPAVVLQDSSVNDRIFDAFRAEGADAWFADGAKERFLSPDYDPSEWEKIDDILDVWFDSGSTHAFCLEQRDDLKWPADLYLEGSDQHRGWFHSSLLESCGTRGRAPYDAVLTHGFTMAEDGRKMSKSLGNTIAPQDVIKQYGADILRLWVASSDYSDDQRIGPEILKTNADAYRKLRNTIRWMLGSLAHYDGTEVAVSEMPELERLMLHRLYELDAMVRSAYDTFDFKKITSELNYFMGIELSAFYFDIRKDALYCDGPSSARRKAALYVIHELFMHLTAWLAPVMPFTMEETWLSRFPSDGDSVHFRQFPQVSSDWKDQELADKWAKVRELRRVVTGALEIERREKRIGSSLEAAPKVYVTNDELLGAMDGIDLADLSITSQAELINAPAPEGAFTLDDVDGVGVIPALAEGQKCQRSWKILPEVGQDSDYPDLSLRDAAAMRELDTQ
ncbi:isoleucine--tRNA ligase [Cohaesibacter gelatinilyticus]|uniref:Isoleucine--tRNA ligase n=1 Tax=Cohaesibacter gelatinilyticus TaxID=372072 RepID=A0A285NEA0_9HYPH|nr:isoleucine--tRNA ligase [Cohaesibacter gelatinilyticus]SNZ05981.1 Isoleucyl-tRNA synthetase [Cohaesibacter gelatinilyticus]